MSTETAKHVAWHSLIRNGHLHSYHLDVTHSDLVEPVATTLESYGCKVTRTPNTLRLIVRCPDDF